jgi:hypothetical protein
VLVKLGRDTKRTGLGSGPVATFLDGSFQLPVFSQVKQESAALKRNYLDFGLPKFIVEYFLIKQRGVPRYMEVQK